MTLTIRPGVTLRPGITVVKPLPTVSYSIDSIYGAVNEGVTMPFTVATTAVPDGTFTVGSGHPFSQAITVGYLRKLVRGLGIAIYGGDNLTITWYT